MRSVKKIFTSVRAKLFLSLCIIVLAMILLLILLNNFVLESFYLYNKQKTLKNIFNTVDGYYISGYGQDQINDELDKIAIKYDFEIMIKNNDENVYYSNKDFFADFLQIYLSSSKNTKDKYDIIEETDGYVLCEFSDTGTNTKYLMIYGTLNNGYKIYIRMPVSSIEESIKISNKFLYIIAIIIIIFGAIVISIISKRFSKPIEELETIAKKMSNLDFSQKYVPSKAKDEVDRLGESINTLSRKLEITIEQLKATNLELEKDVEEKSQLDEMRRSFISDVSHELKTPIALIQGYSEGLIENVNSDEESRKFYAEVIQDEATKMDKLVKQLLELMKLEYGKLNFNNTTFDIIELEKEIIRKSQVMIEKENIEVEFTDIEPIMVYADDFYMDQVITNYVTNAIKYSTEINGVKKMKITNEIKGDKVRVTVFNTLEGLSEEEFTRIWNRFYKVDESRNRSKGGNGIGLSLVKAIMNNYGNDFGARNVVGGVEFYFEVDLEKNV